MDPFMRLVKVFVVVSGILLVVGSITLVALLITRGAGSTAGTSFERTLTTGGRVASIIAVGERLGLLVETRQGQLLILLDTKSGREVGRIRLIPE